MTTLTEQEISALQQRIAEQELQLRDQQARLDANTKPITESKPTMAVANHEALTTFNPGRDQATVGDRWEKWLQVWDLYLASQGLDEKEDGEYKVKTLKPLFLLKMGEEAREVYNGKRKNDSSDKLSEIIRFMTDHYKPKRSSLRR